MRLMAFQGLRYTAAAGDSGSLAAPPYDQVNDAARARFHALSPHQFVHLTRPLPPAAKAAAAPPAGTPAAAAAPAAQAALAPNTDPYRWAAALHQAWLREGYVERDEAPSLYPYVIDLVGGGRRLGVMALVGYEPPSVIRPHEQTLDKPLADRTALLEATRIDLEPALLLAEDDGQLETLLAADLGGPGTGREAAAPLAGYRDDDGHLHRIYRIADPRRIAAYQQAVAARPAAIADGHHRYKVGQRFAEAHHAAPGTAAAGKLAVVTSMLSPELAIDPIHRALRERIDAGRVLQAVGASGAPWRGASGGALAAAVAAAPQPALGVWVNGNQPEIWHLAPVPGEAPALAHLVVEIFQDRVLPALGFDAQAATDGTLVYRSNPDELYAQVASGELGTGFWLPPMQPAELAAAIAGGALLPPKSTRFLPKAMSGLVWSDHASAVS